MPEPEPRDRHLRETPVDARLVHDGAFMRFRVDTVRDPDGGLHQRMVVDHPGAVTVLPLRGRELLMVRQFRHAAGSALLELPAGTLDRRPDGSIEPPDEAAPRELAEETGHRAGRWQRLGSFWTAPGFATELMHLYLARDLSPIEGYAGPEPDERLDVVPVDRTEALRMCESGAIVDAKTMIGCFWLDRLAARGELD
ncbi:MAG TPA: NUDIX hydrolase [Candidatus Limnocylindrales bacterium]|nr:NUDIX hydrolase [Candidatus Limnocylindrales bacterium]